MAVVAEDEEAVEVGRRGGLVVFDFLVDAAVRMSSRMVTRSVRKSRVSSLVCWPSAISSLTVRVAGI